ncbi:MAG: bifunctional methylenetetrahydrofolate dehydrogenase/methenyltetrahydrofolate cyclohydrolase FolD [Chlamydiota bacterium]
METTMIIDGKQVADKIINDLSIQIRQLPKRPPGLAIIGVGEDPASQVYIRMKIRRCEEVGIYAQHISLPPDISQLQLQREIDKANKDPRIDGLIVQLPLPDHLDPFLAAQAVAPHKDVDGLHPINIGKLVTGQPCFVPCTPLGIQTLLKHYSIPVAGKHVVIAGRSNIVGKPMAALLLQRGKYADATVTVAHSRTPDLKGMCRQADILISAIGAPHIITADMVAEGATVIDVGMNRIPDSTKKSGYRLTGDVDFANVQQKCDYITPVPKGVGPMTVAMLLSNTFNSYLSSNSDEDDRR